MHGHPKRRPCHLPPALTGARRFYEFVDDLAECVPACLQESSTRQILAVGWRTIPVARLQIVVDLSEVAANTGNARRGARRADSIMPRKLAARHVPIEAEEAGHAYARQPVTQHLRP